MKVRLFAWFREKTGREEVEIEGERMKVRELVERLAQEVPQLAEELRSGRYIVAVNHRMAGGDAEVDEDSEVAIFPPVAGG